MGDPTVTAPTDVLGMGTIIALLAIAVTYWLLQNSQLRKALKSRCQPHTIQCVEKETEKKWGDPALTTLTVLGLDSNQITDVTPLQHLTALTQLDLDSNRITDVTPLQHLTVLTHLCLHENQITAADPTVVELKSRGVSVIL